MKCYSQFKNLLSEWKVKNDWRKEFMGGLKNSMLISPTENFGEWVLVMSIDDGTVVSKASQTGRLEVSYKTDKCIKVAKPFGNEKVSSAFISDKEIETFILKNKTGAIYVWSPRMGLSQKGISEIKKASLLMKLPLLILMEKDVSEKELISLQKQVGKVELRKVDSFDLKMRNVGMHYPALMVFKNGQIQSGVKYGYEKADGYQLDLRKQLK